MAGDEPEGLSGEGGELSGRDCGAVEVLAVIGYGERIGGTDGGCLVRNEFGDVLGLPAELCGQRWRDFDPIIGHGVADFRGFHCWEIQHQVDPGFRDQRGSGDDQAGGGVGGQQRRKDGCEGEKSGFHGISFECNQ